MWDMNGKPTPWTGERVHPPPQKKVPGLRDSVKGRRDIWELLPSSVSLLKFIFTDGMLKNTDMLVTGNLENRRRWQEGITYNAVMFRETLELADSRLYFLLICFSHSMVSTWPGMVQPDGQRLERAAPSSSVLFLQGVMGCSHAFPRTPRKISPSPLLSKESS